MQKVVKFLEGYVQWLALGLGLLWMAWVGYAYWLQKPVFQTIEGKAVGPADVDEYVARPGGQIDQLAQSLKNMGKTPPAIAEAFSPDKAPQYAALFKKEMALDGEVSAPIASMWQGAGSVVNEKVIAPEVAVNMASLPDVSKTAEMKGTSFGMSVAYVPDPTVAANPANTTQKLFTPGVNNVLPVPGNPAAGVVNPAVGGNAAVPVAAKPIVMVPREITWVTASAKLKMDALAKAFDAAGVPQGVAFTQVLRVTLKRQEQLADGQWSKEQTTIKGLAIESLPQWPPVAGTEGIYAGWAATAVADIAAPPFYEVLRGSPWHMPGTPEVADPNAPASQPVVFDPAQVKPADVPSLTADQKKLYYAYVQAKAAEKAKADAEARKARNGAKPPAAGGSRGAAGGAMAPVGGEAFAARQPRPNPNDPRNSEGGAQPRAPRPYVSESGGAAATPAASGGVLPPGVFSPAAATAVDIDVWAHDETTVPGHIYRYKLVISLKNPLFANLNMAKNPDDTKKLAIDATTEWSEPVLSPKRQYFFAASPGGALLGNNPSMKFDYFWWEDGDWKKTVLELHPGDAVKKTSWTLVDFRPNGSAGDNRAILVSETGEIESHFYKTDQTSAEYRRVSGLVKPATATAAGAG